MYWALRFVPKNHLSFLIGRLAEIRRPRFLVLIAMRIFARLTSINMAEAELPLEAYASVADLFTRRLKPGLRPLQGKLVSPVDGTLREAGEIKLGRVPQVKGKDYSLAEFIGDGELAKKFESGWFYNLYLSPKDYHRVHAPVSGSIEFRRYIPGKLWPVNDWSINNIDNLFSINERVVIAIKSDFGLVLAVMVGATNVGKISLAFDNLITNQVTADAGNFLKLNPPKQISAGEELGTFHLGSTVVLIFESAQKVEGLQPRAVKVGEVL